MKSDLQNWLLSANRQRQALNWMREYLQARVLAILQQQGAMIPLAFHGGTALRFLYQLPRYSEDLDFSLENPDKEYDFASLLEAISNQLVLEGYPIKIKFNEHKTVQHAFIGFPGLLYQCGLSPHIDQNFSVKLEVDTRPPSGAGLSISLIRYRELMLNIQHHDRASLLAGKVHAVLQRKYLKGRDIFDLVWYLSDRTWPLPKFKMLNHALQQSGWDGAPLNETNWKMTLHERLSESDLKVVREDVAPFLTQSEQQSLLTRENINSLLLAK